MKDHEARTKMWFLEAQVRTLISEVDELKVKHERLRVYLDLEVKRDSPRCYYVKRRKK